MSIYQIFRLRMSRFLGLSKTFRRFSSDFAICRRKPDGSLEEAVFPIKNAVDLVRSTNLKVASNYMKWSFYEKNIGNSEFLMIKFSENRK